MNVPFDPADGPFRRDLQVVGRLQVEPELRRVPDVLEILEHRDAARSTIFTSQLPRAEWHVALGDPTIADAILDRLVHNAHEFALTGPSQRGERTTSTKK